MASSAERIFDLSGGIQTGSSWITRKGTEIENAENYRFDKEISSAVGRNGYTLLKQIATTETVTGFFKASYDDGEIWFISSDDGSQTSIRYYDPNADTITSLVTGLDRNVFCNFILHLNEVYVAGQSTTTGDRMSIRNFTYDGATVTDSTTRNLFTAPKAKYVGENSGKLYAINVEIDGVVYPDRAYESSPPMGNITFVKGDQDNNMTDQTLINQVPLMTSDTAPSGTAAGSTDSTNAYKAFDRDDSTTWQSTATTGWIRYDFGASNSKVIVSYAITGVPSAGTANKAPKSWTFEGSDDASSWTTLATVSNESAWAIAEQRIYTTTNTTAYRYYRLNVSANEGNGTNLTVAGFELYADIAGTRFMQMDTDSVRYIKEGMGLDVYESGTDTKLATITVNSVNNIEDTFTYAPVSQTGITFDATANDLTFSSTLNSEFVTGTPVRLYTTGALPTGLTAGTTYYLVKDSSTEVRLATSYANSQIANIVDFSTTGSGTAVMERSYVFGDNDEIWLQDRHGADDFSVLWNTDYRKPQTADFLRIPTGLASDTTITGWGKAANRLILFTSTSTHQYDNANFLPVYENIGCISHDTICTDGTVLYWLDAEGKVRIRDWASGQDETISRLIKNRQLDQVPAANLSSATATLFDSNYILNVGQISSGVYWKFVYSINDNCWWKYVYTRELKYPLISRVSGKSRLYWAANDGTTVKVYLDEDGSNDDGASIPFTLQIGKRSLGSEYMKSPIGAYVYGENLTDAQIMIMGDDENKWHTESKLKSFVSKIPIVANVESRYYDFKISSNTKGTAPIVRGLSFHYKVEEDNFGQ